MKEKIKAELLQSIEVKKQVIDSLIPQVEQAAKLMVTALKNGIKIMFFGNHTPYPIL